MKYWLSLAFEPVDQLLDHARTAEELGYHGVVLPDHVVIKVGDRTPHPSAYPLQPEHEFVDAFCAFAAMAAVTTRLHFMNLVHVVPLRDPFTLAKQVSSVAQLSNQRVALGAGVGWLVEEFDTVGPEFAARGARMDEMLDILRDFWDDGYAEHHGQHFDFPRSAMFPRPTKKIPIVVGGHSMAAATRAARYDGYIPMRRLDAQTRAEFRHIDQLREAAGRDAPFDRIVAWSNTDDPARAHQLEDMGITGIIASPWTSAPRSLADKHADATRFAASHLTG